MYLHLGQDTLVNTKDIIGVFDLDTSTVAGDTRAFLAGAEKARKVVNVSMELPKSFVVTAGSAGRCRFPTVRSPLREEKRQKKKREISRENPRKIPQNDIIYISQLSSATLKGRYDEPFYPNLTGQTG